VHLDSNTIIIAGSTILVLQGFFFLYFWWRDRTALWLLFWAAPLIVGGASLVFYTIPHWQTDAFNIVVGNLIRILSLSALWQGVRMFLGRPVLIWPIVLVSITWLGACLVPAIGGDVVARIVIVSLLNAMFCGLTALELWTRRGDVLPSHRPLMLTFTSFGFIMLVRASLAGVAPFPVGIQPVDTLWLAGFTLLVFGHFAFGAILFFSMTRERREEEQRGFAMSDPLTGLMNRRAFSDFSERMNRRRSGLRRAMALLVLDLDHFKSINDRFGHDTGDRMLKCFAEIAETNVRPSDRLFRVGGEEFCFLLPETTIAEAKVVAERIRQSLELVSIDTALGRAETTVSIGIAATDRDVPIDVLVAAADAALYEAKARGRNRIVTSEPGALLREVQPQAPRRRA
jgi:diguanylate cyclase (GGDEF)-like protein